jgi:hypothetical protein
MITCGVINLGPRITATQARPSPIELAKTLGIAQQTMAHYEGGHQEHRHAHAGRQGARHFRRRPARHAAARSAGKRGPAPKIQQQLERIEALSKTKQRAIAQVLDSMLAQSSG